MSGQPLAGREPAARVIGPVSVTDFVRYQGASGDFNPIHHDHLFATASGYEGPLGIGMFAAGAASAWASDWLGPEHVRRTRVRWKRPVFAGHSLHLSGRVVREYTEAGEDRVDLELFVHNQDGELAVQGWMSFTRPPWAGPTPAEAAP